MTGSVEKFLNADFVIPSSGGSMAEGFSGDKEEADAIVSRWSPPARRWAVEYYGFHEYANEEEARHNYELASWDVPAWLVYNDGDGWRLDGTGEQVEERRMFDV